MREVSVSKQNGKVFIVVGDPDDRGNTSKRIEVTETEAAILLMRLKGVFK